MSLRVLHQQTAHDIRALFSVNDEETIIAICRSHTLKYMLEVYRLLSKEDQVCLTALLNKHGQSAAVIADYAS